MIIVVIVYIFVLLIILAYVAVNGFHLVNFRLRMKGDISLWILGIYLTVVSLILAGSILMAWLGATVFKS